MREPSRSAGVLRVLVLLLVGCHKNPPPGPDPDALWDLAPDGTKIGVVATPRAVGMADRALTAARALVKLPDFAAIAPIFDDTVGSVIGKGSLADAGLAPDKGFAVFGSPDGIVVILPVDRDKFLAAQQGTRGADTDTVHGQYCKPYGELYACASSKPLFERIAKGSLRGKLASLGGRGDIEAYAQGIPLAGKQGDAAVAIELEPGQIGIRASWTGPVPTALAEMTDHASPRVDTEHSSSFGVAEVKGLLPEPTDIPIAGGVTVKQLVGSIVGPLTASVPAGTTDVHIQLPLSDLVPARTLIDHCTELGNLFPLADQQKPGACRLSVKASTPFELDAWIEGNELRFGGHKGVAPTGTATAMSPIGAELASGKWTYAFWGRGSILTSTAALPASFPDEAKLTMRALTVVEELGAGVDIAKDHIQLRAVIRTAWANPDDVVAKLVAINAEDALTKGPAIGKAIADASPGSPFAIDFASGQGGLMIPTAVAGMIITSVVPMILRYRNAGAEPGDPAPTP
jgi:hypothetical protein